MMLFILFLGIFLIGMATGYIIGEWPHTQDYTHTPESRPKLKKPAGIFADRATDGAFIVERPDAKTIHKWNEDKTLKDSKQAMKDTLDTDDHLREIKKLHDEYVATTI